MIQQIQSFSKSFLPFLLQGLIFSFFLFKFNFESILNFGFYIFIIFLHYALFLSFGIVVNRIFLQKNFTRNIIIQLAYLLTFLFVGIVSIGSYFAIQHWHYPINLTLMLDFLDNHKSYFLLFLDINYYLILTLSFILILVLFGGLNFLHNYNIQIIQGVDTAIKKASYKILLIGIIPVLIFVSLSQRIYPYLIEFKQEFVAKDPLSHFYYSSISRYIVKSKVAQAEQKIATVLKNKYPLSSFPKPSKNVILITIDALRKDFLPSYGFEKNITPFLDSYLKRNKHVIVKQPLAVCNYTVGGTASILDGRLSDQIGIKNLSLQNYLSHWGYQNNFILSGNHAGFGYMDLLFGNTLNFYQEGTIANHFMTNDDLLIPFSLNEYFEESKRETTSNFFWFHLMSVHISSKKQPNFIKYQPSDISMLFSQNKEGLKERYINNYMNGILQMDDILKQTLNILEEKNILKNSIIVITSDHGESLGENGIYSHANKLNYNELNIPLIIIDNDLPDSLDISFASQIDIAPTIIDQLKLPIPDDWKGKSILNPSSHYIPLSSSEKDEFGVATPFNNTWVALIKNRTSEKIISIDKNQSRISVEEIPDSIRNKLEEKWDYYFK
jgi:glucan phosphoethanolaminetransferase (alkaline phosphatase superfamily)